MTEMTTAKTGPEGVIGSFAKLIGAGELDAALALYEDDAAFVPEPGRTVHGRDAIRSALEAFVALRPTLTGAIDKVVIAGETALVTNRWTLSGTDPEGREVRMEGKSADVLRLRGDGSWGILIDDPWGGG
jgi:uncharacterized protein (TIGR02246 family)